MEVEERKTMKNYIRCPAIKDLLNTQYIQWREKIYTKVHYHKISECLKEKTCMSKTFRGKMSSAKEWK